MGNIKGKFVYFPLHLQPEMTTDTLGGEYENQLLAIARLSNLIPDDWTIVVKENPKQSYYKRIDKFFECLAAISKVTLVARTFSTYELIEECQFVATITGTVGWEAISGGKNVLIFGHAWYRELPGVLEYKNITSIDEILRYEINHNELEEKYNIIVSCMFDGVADNIPKGHESDIYQWCKNYDEEKNHKYVYDALKFYIEHKYM